VKKALIFKSDTILKAIEVITNAGKGIAVVVDENSVLLGTVSDGDVRRGLLRGVQTSASVTEIMNANPLVCNEKPSKAKAAKMMKDRGVRQLPVVDKKGFVQEILSLSELEARISESWVVLMAGGRGIRLMPLTENIPKPMLPLNGTPILELLIEKLKNEGFDKFYLSIGYLGEKIVSHFGDGSKFGVSIRYLKEDAPLGTAGSLSLIEETVESPLVVMNGDVLTNLDINHLLDFHNEVPSQATLCVRDYTYQVPFGVIDAEGDRVRGLQEKPVFNHRVSAGMYVLAPEALAQIPKGGAFDMTDLVDQLILKKETVRAFPLNEYCIDIGHKAHLEEAGSDVSKYFPKQES